MNALYNKKYLKNPLSSKSFKKHLEYYQLQNPVYLDQYSPELLLYAVKSDCDSVWQSIDDQVTYTIVKNYIEKKEGNDRLLLLFLFNYISYIEIDSYTYFRNENPHPVKPLRNAAWLSSLSYPGIYMPMIAFPTCGIKRYFYFSNVLILL